MGTSPALTVFSLAIAFGGALGAPSTTSTNNSWNVGIGGDLGIDVDNPSFQITSTMTNTKKNECTHKLYVYGKGVNDTFDLTCDTTYNGVTSISSEDYALYENPKVVSFYTETPSTLVVIKNGKCTKRSYKTVKDKTTHTESSMNEKECKEIKKKMEEKKEENRKYWEQWEKNFKKNMKKRFPPCFPFCDKDKSSEEEKDKETSEPDEDSGSYEITETDKTSPEYWRQWQKNFDAKMKKKFPPCFPYCDKKDPSKSDKDDKKQDKPKKSQRGSSESLESQGTSEEEDVDSWNF